MNLLIITFFITIKYKICDKNYCLNSSLCVFKVNKIIKSSYLIKRGSIIKRRGSITC